MKGNKNTKGLSFDLLLFRRILSYSVPYKKEFWSAVAITIALAFISPSIPFLVQYMVDKSIVTPNKKLLVNISAIVVGLLILEALLQFLNSFITNVLGQSIIYDLRTKVFSHITSLRLSFFDKNPIGALVTRVVSDIETIADLFSQGLIVIIGDILKIIMLIVFLLVTNTKVALITLSVFPLLLIAAKIFQKKIKHSFQDVRTQVSRLNSFVQEHITGMNIVQIFNREDVEMEKFVEINKAHRDANIRSIWYYSVFFPVVEILSSVSLALLVWWGGNEIIRDQFTIGELMMFIMLNTMLFRPIRQLADRFNTLQMGMVGAERVFKVMDTHSSIENNGRKSAENIKGEIEFKNVWFSYKEEDWVLKNVSFKIKSGEKVAIVGATGSGKTSVFNLINRFYEFQRGEILVDGIDIRQYELNSLRSKVSVVLQDVFLFSDSIEKNITLSNDGITEKQLINAAQKVGADKFISKLPGQFNYNVKERGAMLSVGQRQMLAFLRAYVHDPALLLLDEATSSVDTESEEMIQHATEIVTQNRTCIIIAHRLATTKNADKIIVMDKGDVIEIGSHTELMEKNGQYKKLIELQYKQDLINDNPQLK